MRSEDFKSETGMMFAPTATKQTPRRFNARDPNSARTFETVQVKQEVQEESDSDVEGYAWQRAGDGKPTTRKKQLCFSLRRLFRLRLDQSFRSIEETRLLFLS